jgi:hypothetical protein
MLVVILLVVVLLWAQPDAASKISTCFSTNKVRGLSEPQILGMHVLSSLAGHGGKGRRGCAGILGVRDNISANHNLT